MKGKLKKLENGWNVLHTASVENGELWYQATPLYTLNDVNFKEGDVVDVDIVERSTHRHIFKSNQNMIEDEYAILKSETFENAVNEVQNNQVNIKEKDSKNVVNKIKNIMNKEISLPKITNPINMSSISINKPNIEFKETLSNFNNVFYGSMFLLVLAVLGFFINAYGVYFLLAPIGYVTICYVGRMVKPYFKKILRDESLS